MPEAQFREFLLRDSPWGMPSTRIAQAGGNPVDGCGKSTVDGVRIVTCTFALQQVDLDQANRIHVGIAQANRSGEYLVVLQQFGLSGNRQNASPGAMELGFELGKHPIANPGV